MVNPKTPEQLEDAEIADAIRTVVAFGLRGKKRKIENSLFEQVKPQVDEARLKGKSVDVHKLVMSLFKESYVSSND